MNLVCALVTVGWEKYSLADCGPISGSAPGSILHWKNCWSLDSHTPGSGPCYLSALTNRDPLTTMWCPLLQRAADPSAALTENFVNKIASKGYCDFHTGKNASERAQWGKLNIQKKLIQSLWKRLSAGKSSVVKSIWDRMLLKQIHWTQKA